MIKQYFYNLVLSVDQLINTILLGDPDETLSQRIARAIYCHCNAPWFVYGLKTIVDGIFFFFFNEKDHCLNSIQGQSNAKEIWKWGR